jgi:hypothetical protein
MGEAPGGPIQAETKPDSAAVDGPGVKPIKAAPSAGNIRQEMQPGSQPWRWPSVSHLPIASHDAKTEMPTNYTFDDFVLIMLHYRRAGTISVLVTSQERVGRTMSRGATAQGEMR